MAEILVTRPRLVHRGNHQIDKRFVAPTIQQEMGTDLSACSVKCQQTVAVSLVDEKTYIGDMETPPSWPLGRSNLLQSCNVSTA